MLTRMPSEPDPSPETNLLYEAKGCLFGTWKNVIVAIWTTQATGPLVSVLSEITIEFSKAHPERFSLVHVIGRGPPLPTAEARDLFVRETRKHSKDLACVGTVLEGSGFWASAVRSFIVGIRFVVPRTFDIQTYASIAEVAAWLPAPHAAKTGVTIDRREFERALLALRRSVD